MAFVDYLIHLGILVGVFSILSISLNYAVGFTGLLNLGHVAFFGIGAYASALMVTNGAPLLAGIIIGALLATVAGALLALPTTRLRGDYLALATLGFAFIMQSVARNWTDVTRGALGIPGIPKIAGDNLTVLIVVGAVAVVCYVVFWRIAKSRFGLTCEAVRDDELAVKMLGKNAFLTKVKAMMVSAGFAGLAGGLFAHYVTFIDPTIFGLGDLILLLSMIIAGGLGSVRGAAVGAVVLFLVPEPLRFIGLPSAIVGPVREMLFALVLLLILIYRPKGLFGKVDLA